MEFFRNIKLKRNAEDIQQIITLNKLTAISNELFLTGNQNKFEAEIGTVWGPFTLNRNIINGGLRFALVECPNALTWTITTGFLPNREIIIIHLTINRKQVDTHFIDEIESFIDAHSACISQMLL